MPPSPSLAPAFTFTHSLCYPAVSFLLTEKIIKTSVGTTLNILSIICKQKFFYLSRKAGAPEAIRSQEYFKADNV